eukprot:GEMP01053879.1.p1 GENE.GEMP01053879.1~~GEMP01053879.1.p1  ORF type:complete len:228 (+),score=44.44 GEMP01053879.1:45-686(+)
MDELGQSELGIYLRDALTLVLEVRMQNPLAFLALYFRTAARVEVGNVNQIAQAFRSLKCLSKPLDHQLYSAFAKIAFDGQVQPADFHNLVSLLLCDLPLTMAAPACDRLVAKAPVRFAAFKYAIDACLALGRFRELACATFRHVLQELGTSPPLKKADMMEVISSDPKIPPAIDKWLPENYIGRDIFIVALYSASRSADDKERLDGSDFVWQG